MRLRIGVAGAGVMGRNHLRVLAALPDAEVVAVADPFEEARVAALALAPGAAGYSDPAEMLRSAPIDAAIIAAPTRFHAELARIAIERGLPLLIEKPLAATPAEALEIVKLAEAHGVPVQIGHVERFNPAVRALRDRLSEGYLADIAVFDAVRESPLPERISDVGVVRDLMVHDLDLACAVLGERPLSISAVTMRHNLTDREDHADALLRFPSGAVAHVRASWLAPSKRRTVRLSGRAGSFRVGLLERDLHFTRSDPASSKLLDGFAPVQPGQTVQLEVDSAEPLRLELAAFIAVARSGGRPAVTAEDGLWAVRMAAAVLASGEAGGAPIDPASLD